MKLHIYYVYILQCADGSYYTGVTNNIEIRLQEHLNGEDTRCYTFSRRPVILKFQEAYHFVYDAISREKQIKGWTRKKKDALISGDMNALKRLAKNRVINR